MWFKCKPVAVAFTRRLLAKRTPVGLRFIRSEPAGFFWRPGAAMLQQLAKLGEHGTFGLVAAFDAAWAAVKSSGSPFSDERYSEFAREILAEAIILAAKLGERNERNLTDAALLALSKENLRNSHE
jgi:hypothetical protein